MIHPLPAHEATDDSAGMLQELSETFKLFSDTTRLQILTLLNKHEELHVQALCRHLGQSQPAVSHHLAMLRLAEVIGMRRSGKFNFYYISGSDVGTRIDSFLDLVFTQPKVTPVATPLSQEKTTIKPVAAASGACQANHFRCST